MTFEIDLPINIDKEPESMTPDDEIFAINRLFSLDGITEEDIKKIAELLTLDIIDKDDFDYVFFAVIDNIGPGQSQRYMHNAKMIFEEAKKCGYRCFYSYGIIEMDVYMLLRKLVQKVKKHLIWYYTGHCSIEAGNKDLRWIEMINTGGVHSCLPIVLLKHSLWQFKREGSIFTAICDTCHSEDIFELGNENCPKGCVNISSCLLDEWATSIDYKPMREKNKLALGYSFFTRKFYKWLQRVKNKDATYKRLEKDLKEKLKQKHQQTLNVTTNTKRLLTTPIFRISKS